ncbi:MAG: hypothetical protein GWN58_58485 [Anaerolineae bacterium]|nr:hypothetical protein [Anaerolineae bacterium]
MPITVAERIQLIHSPSNLYTSHCFSALLKTAVDRSGESVAASGLSASEYERVQARTEEFLRSADWRRLGTTAGRAVAADTSNSLTGPEPTLGEILTAVGNLYNKLCGVRGS